MTAPSAPTAASAPAGAIDPGLFKAYDIRGVVERNLTRGAVRAIGAALGAQAHERAVREIAVGRDGRLSGPWLRDALIDGIRSAGIDVVDIGQVTTPMLYFATYHLQTGSGVEITGSHNPPEYNGLKIVLAGEALYGEDLQRLLPAHRRRATWSRRRRRAHCARIDVAPGLPGPHRRRRASWRAR